LVRGQPATELMKQKQYALSAVPLQGVALFAVGRGCIDDVELNKMGDFESAMHSYVASEHKDLIDKIGDDGNYNDDIENGLKQAVEAFKANHTW